MPTWNAIQPNVAKSGSFIMLLMNLDPKKGLLNGTRLVSTHCMMGMWLILLQIQ
jgi:hypothetical protein